MAGREPAVFSVSRHLGCQLSNRRLRRGSKEKPTAFGEAMSPDALDIANALEDLAAGLRLDPSGGYDHTQNWIVRDAH